MPISAAPLSAGGVSLRTDGGAQSCEYSLHIRNAGTNVKLSHFWTFFQDLCNDGDGKMVYCQLSCRFLTHMTVLCWLYQSLNKMFYKMEGLQAEEKRQGWLLTGKHFVTYKQTIYHLKFNS